MSAAAGTKLAIKAIVYRNTASYASPTWAACPSILDVDMGAEWDTADASSRLTRAKLYGKTQLDLPSTLNVKADNVAADYQAFLAAVFSDAGIDVLILDGPIAADNTFGFRMTALFCGAPQDQSAGNVIYVKFPIKPGFDSNGPPAYCFTASGAGVFTAI